MQVKPLNTGRESPNIPEQQIQQRLDASESKRSLVNIKLNVQKCRRPHEVKSLHQKIKMLVHHEWMNSSKAHGVSGLQEVM